jgi:hypothetical protein
MLHDGGVVLLDGGGSDLVDPYDQTKPWVVNDRIVE